MVDPDPTSEERAGPDPTSEKREGPDQCLLKYRIRIPILYFYDRYFVFQSFSLHSCIVEFSLVNEKVTPVSG